MMTKLAWFSDYAVHWFLVCTVQRSHDHGVNLEKVNVHAGFQRLYSSVRDELIQTVRGLLREKTRKIRVTGHSLGAALATLFTLDAVSQLASPRDVCLVTFGCPRVGNREFAELFNQHVRTAWRIANQFDGVTRVRLCTRLNAVAQNQTLFLVQTLIYI